MNHHRLLPYISGLFVATLLISNTIAGKFFYLGPFLTSAALVVFPLAFIFSDILTEVYGYATTRKVIWTGFAAQILMLLCYQFTVWVTPAPNSFHPEAYQYIFSQTPRLVLASITAYFFGEFLNSIVLAKMKVATNGRGTGWRFVFSTMLGQAADSVLFALIAFSGVYPFEDLCLMIVSLWILKVLWEVIALPITLRVVAAIKKYEHEDYFDRKTNFNPLKLD